MITTEKQILKKEKTYLKNLIKHTKELREMLDGHGAISSTTMLEAYKIRKKINYLIGYILALEKFEELEKE